jgi:ParB-like nuclease domain
VEIAAKLSMVPIRQIRPYHRNVRKNDLTVEKLVELIPKVGFNVPLVLDRKNIIVKGHSRWRAAIRLGMKELPCVYTDADEETIKFDRLADNRVHEFSVWDERGLAMELELVAPNFAPELVTLDWSIPEPPPIKEPGESDEAPAPEPPPEEGPGDQPEAGPAPARPDYIEVVCNQCGERLRVSKRGADA